MIQEAKYDGRIGSSFWLVVSLDNQSDNHSCQQHHVFHQRLRAIFYRSYRIGSKSRADRIFKAVVWLAWSGTVEHHLRLTEELLWQLLARHPLAQFPRYFQRPLAGEVPLHKRPAMKEMYTTRFLPVTRENLDPGESLHQPTYAVPQHHPLLVTSRGNWWASACIIAYLRPKQRNFVNWVIWRGKCPSWGRMRSYPPTNDSAICLTYPINTRVLCFWLIPELVRRSERPRRATSITISSIGYQCLVWNYLRHDTTWLYSKIDLVLACHQIPVANEDSEKNAITTTFGLFEFPSMLFGLYFLHKHSRVLWMASHKTWMLFTSISVIFWQRWT